MTKDDRAFFALHDANPEIFRQFRKYAVQARNAGHLRYSSWALMQRVKWHINVETGLPDGPKISNVHIARYARLLLRDYPRFQGFLELRPIKHGSLLDEGLEQLIHRGEV